MTTMYWPEEGVREFASHDDGETWHPLCDKCGEEMEYRFTPWGSWHCCGVVHLIWAEDWPDAEPEDDDA